jgi:hypothetical protein
LKYGFGDFDNCKTAYPKLFVKNTFLLHELKNLVANAQFAIKCAKQRTKFILRSVYGH